VISHLPVFARIIFPAANSDDSIPFAASLLFGNLTEWDCTNEDHRPVICFRVGRMHWQSAERRHEANCRRSMRPAHGRCGDGVHDDLSHRRGLRCLLSPIIVVGMHPNMGRELARVSVTAEYERGRQLGRPYLSSIRDSVCSNSAISDLTFCTVTWSGI
jgi:hypothetical protein